MNPRPYFIVSLTWPDALTLVGLGLAVAGIALALGNMLSLAIALMLLAMLFDMFDGLLARRLHVNSEFGRQLDSFCDVFTYLVLPLFILYQFGMQDLLSVAALFAFLAAGLLRLSRFNIAGTVQEAGIEYHLGLQVIWSHLLVVLAFPVWHWLGMMARFPLVAVLLAMSFFMIRNLRFRKPVEYGRLTVLILAVAALYVGFHQLGWNRP